MTTRREFVRAALLISGGVAFSAGSVWADAVPPGHDHDRFSARMHQLEKASGGRLGVFCLDTGSHVSLGWREHERFPMCSTFKLLLVGAVLARVNRGEERLYRVVHFDKRQLVDYSPITSRHVSTGMTVRALCMAAMTVSDNTAANLLLASLGGPKAVTAFIRSLGDRMTRLDRNEPDVNECLPGDPRDTTTPADMVHDLHALVLGNALSPSSRGLLTRWLVEDQTGENRIRAGLPATWREGDKTGSGDHGTANDVAILWSPHRKPVLVAAYLTEATVSRDAREATLAGVGRAVAELM